MESLVPPGRSDPTENTSAPQRPAPEEGRLRVLLIGPLSEGFIVGGTAVSFRQLVRELRALADVEIEVLDTSRGERTGRSADLRAALRTLFEAPLRIYRAEVVTFHASTRATLWFAPILSALCGIMRRPLVIREFGGSFDTDWAALSGPARALLRRALRGTWLLLQTRFLVSYFEPLLPATRCRWYANSRPLVRRVEARPESSGGARRFVWIGHVRPPKGIGELLAASRMLGAREICIDVYGPFLQGSKLQDFEHQSTVRYCGVLPPERVPEVLRGYDVFVLPTYHFAEGYPGAILEAFAEGLPVITTRFRSLPEIVEDGVSGILIEPGDPESLAAAMTRLHDDDALMAELRKGAAVQSEKFESRLWTRAFVDLCRQAWATRLEV